MRLLSTRFSTAASDFLDIPRVVETTLNESPNANASVDTLDGVLAVDARAREVAAGICRRVVN